MMQGFPISRRRATLCIDLFGSQKSLRRTASKRSALATHIHRIRAMAHWKAVTGARA